MTRVPLCASLVVFVGLFTYHVSGEEKLPLNDPLGKNAALRYFQAFITMPEADPVGDRFTGDWENVPLDQAAVAFIAKHETSLGFLREGARLPRCAWGLNYDKDPGMLMPHLSKGRQLARIACLNARRAFAGGDQERAVEDVITILTFARHAGSDGMLVSKLVGYAVETMAIELAADNVWRLSEAMLKKLTTGLKALPPEVSLRDGVLAEKEVFIGWMIRKLKTGDASVVKELGDFLSEEKASIAAASGGTPEGLLKLVEETGRSYGELAEILALPLTPFEAKADAFEKKVENSNPVTRQLLPALRAIRYREATHKARVAMFLAAMGVITEGRKKLADFPDPLGEGTFEYLATEDGFELRSKHAVNGQLMSLRVKQPAM